MFKMIGDFKFDLEQDCYVNSKNGVKLVLIPDGKTFIVRFRLDNVTRDYCMSAYWDDVEERIEEILKKEDIYKELLKLRHKSVTENILNSEEYKKQQKDLLDFQRKTLEIYKRPKEISKETIKECINKSNAAEVNFLEKRVSNLESRVKTLEDSVEDLEDWRHS